MLTQKIVKELFDYDNGNLIRKKSIQSRSLIGQIAGTESNNKRFIISINYRRYKLHRVIWLWHYGNLPTEIDHIDGDPSNNKIENLRPASRFENMRNVKKLSTNTSGYKGVNLHKPTGKWRAYIVANNKQHHLGLFENKEDAYLAYCNAAKKLHKDFARVA